jgi:hypothetical protein
MTGFCNFQPFCGLSDPDHYVNRSQSAAVEAEDFADQALHADAGNGPGHVAFCGDDAELGGFVRGIVPDLNCKEESLAPAGEPSREARRAAQPRRARQSGANDVHTARRARPLARRALITARPPRDFIRTRKPWVRLRRVLDGWYVRFISE